MPDVNFISQALLKYDTPFFIYDGNTLLNEYHNLVNVFNDVVDIFYSFKANPNIGVCQILQEAGAGAEICSYHELLLAEKAYYDPKDIIVVGPYKCKQLIEKSLNIGVFAIVCESWYEYEKISTIAESLQIKAHVLIRINPKTSCTGAFLTMGGKATQFGIEEDKFFNELTTLKSNNWIEIIGIHVYVGTRILNYQDILQNIKTAFDLFSRVQQIVDFPMKCIDFGGGFGVNYFPDEHGLDLEKLKKQLEPLLRDFCELYQVRIIAESGRFLTAKSGVLAMRIEDIKNSYSKTYVITNSGSNCFLAAANSSIFKRNFPITVVSNKIIKEKRIYQICGPLCTPGDLIAKDIELAELEIGDILLFHKSGAYGLSASPIIFLSQTICSEIVWYRDKLHLTRDGKDLEAIYTKQNLLLNN